jgi:hypothetical protein
MVARSGTPVDPVGEEATGTIELGVEMCALDFEVSDHVSDVGDGERREDRSVDYGATCWLQWRSPCG